MLLNVNEKLGLKGKYAHRNLYSKLPGTFNYESLRGRRQYFKGVSVLSQEKKILRPACEKMLSKVLAKSNGMSPDSNYIREM